MAGKRKNPDYYQMCVYIPRELAVKFKTICTSEELELSEVMAVLIQNWVAEKSQSD